jgi:hypothetical protein
MFTATDIVIIESNITRIRHVFVEQLYVPPTTFGRFLSLAGVREYPHISL